MSERYWYIKENKQEGPLSKEGLTNLLESKEITKDTLVWTQEMDSWQLLSSMNNKREEGPPPIPKKKSTRPWVRYWARMVDYSFFGFIVGFFMGLFSPSMLLIHPVLLGAMIIFAWSFIEAALLSTWGLTPGKWLLRTEVRQSNGRKPDFRNALSRSLSVWLLGMGAGVPLISIITMIVACVKLSNNGITSWDKSNQCIVTHHRIGFWRTFFVILIFFILFILVVSNLRNLPQQIG